MSTTVREWPIIYRDGRDLPPDSPWGSHHRIVVTAGLHHLQGNARPYFSVTYEIVNKRKHRSDDVEACGSMDEEILRWWPDLAPVVALHLSDDEGVPMHAVANARYWLGLTEFKEADVRLEPDGGLVHVRLPHLPLVASHLRISFAEAGDLAARYPADSKIHPGFDEEINAMRPRWAQEALAAVVLLERLLEERRANAGL